MSKQPLRVVLAPRTDPMRVLEEIQRLAVEQLGGLPGTLFAPVDHAINNPERTDPLPYADQSAMRVLRQRHATHVMNFRQQIAHGFDEFRARRRSSSSRRDLPLGLIDEAQLDFHFAGQHLADAIEQRYPGPLQLVEGRLRALAIDLGLPPALNPIGATRLVSAFVGTFGDEQISPVVRDLMFAQYEQELARVLGDLYARVNTLLAGNGYAVIDKQPQAATAAPASSAAPASTAAGPAHADAGRYQRGERRDPGSATTAAWDRSQGATSNAAQLARELDGLRTSLHQWREAGLASEPAAGASQADASIPPASGAPTSHRQAARPAPPRRELRVEEVVSVASLLQSEPIDAFARALAGSGLLRQVIRHQLNEGSRRLGNNPDQTSFSVEEEDAIDMIALLFDSLFKSNHLQDRSRRLYARLVLPLVKVALTDPSLFVQPHHPARCLLDAITEACADNHAETPQERELLAVAATASQRIVTEYNEDLAIFEVARTELDALLLQQRRRIDIQIERAASSTSGRERLGQARKQADAIVAQVLAGSPLSWVIGDFLATSWRHHLVQVLLRESQGTHRQVEALSLGNGLVAADRIAARGEGPALARQLLALEPGIVACLGSSGLDSSAARYGLALLVRGLAFPHTPRELHALPASPEHQEDIAERDLWLAGGTDTVTHDPVLAERMRQLQPGDWLQLVDERGVSSSARVAWVSPLTSRRLLVNRRGLRVLVASAEELALLAGNGRLVLGDESTPFDEAMRDVRQHLDRAAA